MLSNNKILPLLKTRALVILIINSITNALAPQHIVIQREHTLQNSHSHFLQSTSTQPFNFLNTPAYLLLASSGNTDAEISWNDAISSLKFQPDRVVRVLDANTVKLEKLGVVNFAFVQTPSGYKDDFRYPDCFSLSPASKARKLLPNDTKVQIRIVDDAARPNPKALILLTNEENKLLNYELVKEGFAKVKNRASIIDKEIPGLYESLILAQKQAEEKGKGMFKQCDSTVEQIATDNQFEPLEYTTEIQYGADGGTLKIRSSKDTIQVPPVNPISPDNPLPLRFIRKCADFDTYEDALRYYEKYYPYYGDVAKLDKDEDGIPCEGLPHTLKQEQYRMKKPSKVFDDQQYKVAR